MFPRTLLAVSALALLSACTVGPAYQTPGLATATPLPEGFKALDG